MKRHIGKTCLCIFSATTTILDPKTKLFRVQILLEVISDNLLKFLTFKIDYIQDFMLEIYNVYKYKYENTLDTTKP